MEKIELRDLVGGALQEQFTKAFEKVIVNLQNPNTSYRNSREITIKLKFTQNEQRDDVKCGISVAEKLAPQSPMETSFAVGTDLRTGKLYAHEYGNQLRGQITIDEVIEPQKPEREYVDKETGEIIAEQPTGVIDLRNAVSK